MRQNGLQDGGADSLLCLISYDVVYDDTVHRHSNSGL